ncbi:MAG: hypothetical protein MJZ36_07245 [Bacteroidaceae bacterium]|nr:hypothetical protein [Bacteroidaceae bacterium]
MRKFYSFFAFAVLMLASVVAKAQEFTLPSENGVLQNETYNMRLFKTWNFIALTVNDKPITPDVFTTGDADDTGMPVCDGYVPVKVTNEGMEGWYMGIGNIEFNASKGLYNNKNGIRYAILSGLKEGQILCIQGEGGTNILEPEIGEVHTYAVNCNRIQKQSLDGTIPAWTASYLSNNNSENVVEEITDEIHAIQNEGVDMTAEDAVSLADNYRYFRVIIDGPLYIAFGKNAAIQGVQIWIDAAAEESVSTPSYKVVGVNGTARNIELTVGESTLGAACKTTYGIVDEGGSYDDYEYDQESGYFTVTATDDSDGDGIVTIIAATTSENGAVSEIVEFKVNVGEVVLNAPTVSLVGFNGAERIYSIEWANNTLCGESFNISCEADGGSSYTVFEPNAGIGETFTATTDYKVTVTVEGYTDGVLQDEAFKSGVNIRRKNADKAAAGAHDWDFVHLSDYQKALIQQDPSVPEAIDKYYVVNAETSDTTYISVEEYNKLEAEGVDVSNYEAAMKSSGWWEFDTGKGRTSLKVIEGGWNANADGYGYEEDAAKIWEGIDVSNPPYVNSANAQTSSILLYINDDLGLYFGTKPVFTFPREAVAAGELVLMYIGYGGSNYTNSRYPVIGEAPVDAPYSITLGNNPHVFYIDVYTYDNLPADEFDPTAVTAAPASTKVDAIYSINGTRLTTPQKGINIVKLSDGSVKKIMVK